MAVEGARSVPGSGRRPWSGRAVCAGLMALTGCFVPGTADPPPAAPTPVPVVVVASSAAAPAAPVPETDGGSWCGATLRVGELRRSSASCFVDEVVTRTPGTLRYPCAGGAAEALFGPTARFTGSARDGNVDVKITTDFSFSDGCRWRSVQLIQGNVPSGQLAFSYRENPVEGQSGCAAPCSADGVVLAQ